MISTSTRANAPWSTTNKVGLGLIIFYAVANIPGFLFGGPEGETGPPLAVLVAASVLGLVGAVAGVVAWRSGSRPAARLSAASIVVITLTSLPAFFVDVPAGIKALVAAGVIFTVTAVALTLSSPRGASRR
jgi:hypothetical protein